MMKKTIFVFCFLFLFSFLFSGCRITDKEKTKNEVVTYTITYELDGGINHKSNPNSIKENETITLLNPTKDGYSFSGWFRDKNGGERLYKLENITSDIILYALWHELLPEDYTITYDLDGGINHKSNPNSIKENETITLLEPTKEGYIFTGWFDAKTDGNKVEILENVNSNIVLYARWRAVLSYSVTYELDGGENNKDNPVSIKETETITLLAPTKEGYTFVAWYKEQDFRTKITKLKNITSDIKVYAKWEIIPITYLISYELDGGVNNLANPASIRDIDYVALSNPTKEGYVFLGWFDDETNGNKIEVLENINSNIKLYARWEIFVPSYPVIYNLDGGENNKDNPEIIKENETITLLNPTKEGYLFVGWFDEETGGNKVDKLENITFSIKLYARWFNTNEVSYNLAYYETNFDINKITEQEDFVNYFLYDYKDYLKQLKNSYENELKEEDILALLKIEIVKYASELDQVLINNNVIKLSSIKYDEYFEGEFYLQDNEIMLVEEIPNRPRMYIDNEYIVMSYEVKDIYIRIYFGIGEGSPNLIFEKDDKNSCFNVAYLYKVNDLDKITIPDSISSLSVLGILPFAFVDGNNLKEITLPSTLTTIGSGAFYECGLVYSLTLPKSLISIGNNAFYGCINLLELYNLSNLNIELGKESFGMVAYYALDLYDNLNEKSKIEKNDNGLRIYINNDEKIIIGYQNNLKELVIEEGITKINAYVFTNEELLCITLPSSLRVIEDNAFCDCRELKIVINKSSALSIVPGSSDNGSVGRYAFEVINNSEFTGNIISDENGFYYYEKEGNKILISYQGNDHDVVIKEGVTRISSNVFYRNKNLYSVVLPSSLTQIDDNAFYYCPNLLTVYNLSNLAIQKNDSSFGDVGYYAINIFTDLAHKVDVTKDENGFVIYDDGVNKILIGYEGKSKDITIPVGITEIFPDVFNFKNIKSVSFPTSLKKIGSFAFYGCKFETLTFNEGLKDIDKYAFDSCLNLISVSLPSSLTNIDYYAFNNCNYLVTIYNYSSLELEKGSEYFGKVAYYAVDIFTNNETKVSITKDENGILIYDNGVDKVIIGYEGEETYLVIPEGITQIHQIFEESNRYFSDRRILDGVSLPKSLLKIDRMSFYGCPDLVYIVNNSNIEIELGSEGNGYVGYYALEVLTNTDPLPKVLEKDGFKMYEKGTEIILLSYNGNSKDIVIPDGVTMINKYCFKGTYITSVSFPASLRKIGYQAFYNCGYLKNINLNEGLKTIESYAFYNCVIEYITIPSTLEEIKDCAFSDCNDIAYIINLSALEIVAGSYEHGDIAYNVMDVYKDLSANPSVTTDSDGFTIYQRLVDGNIEKTLLDYHGNAKNIVIPEGVTEINANAFSNNFYLEKVNIPQTVKKIGKRAFYCCDNLRHVVINEGIEAIEEEAFYFNFSLYLVTNLSTSLVIEKGSMDNGYLGYHAIKIVNDLNSNIIVVENDFLVLNIDDGENTQNILIKYSGEKENVIIPDVITEIFNNAFCCNFNLETLVIPSSVKTIGPSSFESCSNLSIVTLNKGLENILNNAFHNTDIKFVYNYSELSIEIGSEDYGYIAYNAIDVITDSSIKTSVETDESGFEIYTKEYDGKVEMSVIGYSGEAEDIVIPEGISEIKKNAFKFNPTIRSVRLPASLTVIGDSAFYCCENLSTIYFSIGLKTIGTGAFSCCNKLNILELNEGLEKIQTNAFASCENLMGVKLPKTLTTIEDNAFGNCYNMLYIINLSELDIEKQSWGFGEIAYYATDVFTDTSANPEIISDSNGFILYRRTIEDLSNTLLISYTGESSEAVIPDGVNEIKENAFNYKRDLYSIVVPSSVNKINDYAFSGCQSLLVVYNLSSLSITKGQDDNGSIALYAIDVFNSLDVKASITTDSNGFTIYHREFDGKIDEILLSYSGDATEVTIPDGITEIYDSAFYYCDALETIELNEGLKIIGDYAFMYCNSLKELIIPSTVIQINTCVIEGCGSLTKVTFKEATNWYYYDTLDSEIGTSISSEDLSDSTKALNSLVNYGIYYWKRTVSE